MALYQIYKNYPLELKWKSKNFLAATILHLQFKLYNCCQNQQSPACQYFQNYTAGLPPKLDGVGPVDNKPPTDKLQHFVPPPKKNTCDMWHVTCDTWHVTRDTWHVFLGGGNILSKFQLPSSNRLWFMMLWRSGGKGWVTEWINQLINDEAVYRTAPATPGLLKNVMPYKFRKTYIFRRFHSRCITVGKIITAQAQKRKQIPTSLLATVTRLGKNKLRELRGVKFLKRFSTKFVKFSAKF